MDYRYLGELLRTVPGVYLRETHSEGQYSQINFRGTDWRGITIMSDGRIMNDPATGIYNLYNFTPEYIDRIEILNGPRSFLYELNGAGGAINLVTKHHDSNNPFSFLRYSESAYEYSDVDGTVSQNITEKFNIALGFRHYGSDGRFPNGFHEAWNMRARLRYHLSDRFSLILSEYFTDTQTQLNGGIAPDAALFSTAFSPLETEVRNGDSFEKLNRNDVDLSLVGSLFDTTANSTRLTLYYSNNFREYRDENGGTVPNSVFIQSDHTSSWTGALLTQKFDGGWHRFDLGSSIEIRQIEGSPNMGRRRNVIGNLHAKEELDLGHRFSVAAFGRYDHYLEKNYFGFGGDAKFHLTDHVSLFGGGSFSHRVPTYQELYWTDSTVTRSGALVSEEHTQLEVGAEIGFQGSGFLSVALFHRRVVDPIVLLPFGSGFVFPGIEFANVSDVVSKGLDFQATIKVWRLLIDCSGTYIVQESGGTTLEDVPKFSAIGGIYFMDTLLDDHLTLKTGFRGRYQSGQIGTEFNAEVIAYVHNANQSIGAGATIDFMTVARIGDAYVHFIWENLTEAEFFSTPFYPVLDRSIRFGISWEFLD